MNPKSGAGWNRNGEHLSVFRRTGWCGWDFWKKNGLRVEEDDDLSTRTFRRILGLDFKFSHILLMYSVWNLLHSTHMQLHIYKYIYIFEAYQYIHKYRFFFLKKKNVCNPKCCFSWSSQQRFLVLPLCGTEISAFIFYWLFLFTQKIQMKVTTCMPECR